MSWSSICNPTLNYINDYKLPSASEKSFPTNDYDTVTGSANTDIAAKETSNKTTALFNIIINVI